MFSNIGHMQVKVVFKYVGWKYVIEYFRIFFLNSNKIQQIFMVHSAFWKHVI